MANSLFAQQQQIVAMSNSGPVSEGSLGLIEPCLTIPFRMIATPHPDYPSIYQFDWYVDGVLKKIY